MASSEVAPLRISQIRFGMFSAEEMRKVSQLHVFDKEIYFPHSRNPHPHGVLDDRMGISTKTGSCKTCGLKLADCPGHFGFVTLELPCFHAGFFRAVIEILQRICKSCSRILVSEHERMVYLRKMRNPRLETLQRKSLYKAIGEKCKKCTVCPSCESVNGTVKKLPPLRIVHERFKVRNSEAESSYYLKSFATAADHNPEISQFISKMTQDLTPLTVLEIFRKIPGEDCELLDLDPFDGRPERMILTHLLVPPVCIRPSVINEMTATSNEDDLTMKLREIIQINDSIRSNVLAGHPIATIMADWEFLQLQVAMFINSEMPGFPPSLTAGKPIRSLCTRLKGKRGRFRGNLSGKRVDFSGRTVISPDPNVEIDEVVVPELVAKILTFPERVSSYNIQRLRKAVLNGPDVHPGANFVEFSDGSKKFLRYGDRLGVVRRLQIGDKVERHLMDGDPVLFNRQPSLHRVSIMSHRARVLPGRTFRFNVCCCAPYNADFDGDEMNLHLPQTDEARAEASELMGVLKNLQLPKSGEPGIAPNQDFLTASYLLSRKDQFFDRSSFCMMVQCMGLDVDRVQMPEPVILKPVMLWTGKQLFSVLIRSSKDVPAVNINLETPSKSYTGRGATMCLNDGYVLFYNSELLSGTLDKSILGGGSKNSLFYVIMREISSAYAATCMARLARLTSRWLMNRGFSIGIGDVTPSESVRAGKMQIVTEGYHQCDAFIDQFKTGKLQPQPGCDADQTLEAVLNRALSELRDACGKLCIRELPPRNAPLIMAISGSKGSNINISQMIAVVGQQTVFGSRIPNGFQNRALPHFPLFSQYPAAKGFVEDSFFTGLTGTEFFFHTMAGREGLVDTAVKTAETGYMQRRLMKALEDLSCKYDNTIRNSENGIVQFRYGDDGLSPVEMEGKDNGLFHFERILFDVQNQCRSQHHRQETGQEIAAEDRPLLPKELSLLARSFLDSPATQSFNDKVRQRLKEFFDSLVVSMRRDRETLGLPSDVFSRGKHALMESIYDAAGRFSRRMFDLLCGKVVDKYRRAVVEPGEAVGALGAQSIGEPGTQMTLKTFHFAGVASMNVTLGVPRIKEIINASKNISTPIISASLLNASDAKAARVVKGKIERTLLGEVAEYIREVYTANSCYLSVKLDAQAIENLLLEITAEDVRQSILSHPKIKLKDKHVRVYGRHKLRVFPLEYSRDWMFHSIQQLKQMLPLVLVKGLATVGRAVINEEKGRYNLLVEGTDLLHVMGTSGVDGRTTKSNHVIEIEKTLGIEAARSTIMNEINYVMSSYGMNVDHRHIMLLADVMTFRGEVLGITRFGIGKMKDSVLMLASFEKTTDHLFEAAVHSRVDPILGVSECIITGSPIPIGTGMFQLIQDLPGRESLEMTGAAVQAGGTSRRSVGGSSVFQLRETLFSQRRPVQ